MCIRDRSVGGTVTYEDVTNVDAVGIVTAAKGVRVTEGGLVVTAGIVTAKNIIDASDAQRNTRVGGNAGDSFDGTNANNNTLIGKNAGTAITGGDNNTAVGQGALVTNTTGSENVAVGEQLGETLVGATQQDTANATTVGRTTTTPQFREDQSVKVQGLRTRTDFIDEEGVEVNRTFIPFMRSRKVRFRAQGLKPNTRHFPFFANKDVSSFVKQETFERWGATDSDYSTPEDINA